MSNNKQSMKIHRTTSAILLLILLLGWAIARIDAVFYSVLILSVLGIMYAFIYLGIVRNKEVTMNNNKQSMKLYTEEEILSLLKIHLADEDQADSFVSLLTPIELLSDEEIEKWAEMQSLCEPTGAEKFGRIYGAKWMRDKIQGGNK